MAETEDRLRRLLDVGQTLVSELDPDAVLERILEEAQRLTGARYAALGILDEDRRELERFITAGIDPEMRRRIGELPRGRGVLGVLIEDPRPLRLSDVEAHPESYGFPPGHPPMHSFLGVPIVIRDSGWGNLYLTEKEGGGEFTAADQDAAITLARWAAIAIENARIHRMSEHRLAQLEHAVRSLEASQDISDAIGSVADLDRVLELIVKRGRALVGARSLLIMLREGDDLVVAAGAGHTESARGQRLPIHGSTSGQVLDRGRPQRVTEVGRQLRIDPAEFGVRDASTALLVPLLHRGVGIGVLAAFDHGKDGGEFTDEDERLLRAFAQSAANAVAIKRSVEADRLRSALTAAESERRRWARELHDQTLQALGGLRVLLASSVGRGDATTKDESMHQAVEDIELEIANLREIITDLRPSLLDDLGLVPALEALLDRRRADAVEITSELRLPRRDGHASGLSAELETTVYRLVQESLTNVVKHARATRVQVSVGVQSSEMIVEVRDDGRGFDMDTRTSGFGLAGMRERVSIAGGTLTIESGEGGTLVQARIPALSLDDVVSPLRNEQAAS
jgi:signal transduction histidine kinase